MILTSSSSPPLAPPPLPCLPQAKELPATGPLAAITATSPAMAPIRSLSTKRMAAEASAGVSSPMSRAGSASAFARTGGTSGSRSQGSMTLPPGVAVGGTTASGQQPLMVGVLRRLSLAFDMSATYGTSGAQQTSSVLVRGLTVKTLTSILATATAASAAAITAADSFPAPPSSRGAPAALVKARSVTALQRDYDTSSHPSPRGAALLPSVPPVVPPDPRSGAEALMVLVSSVLEVRRQLWVVTLIDPNTGPRNVFSSIVLLLLLNHTIPPIAPCYPPHLSTPTCYFYSHTHSRATSRSSTSIKPTVWMSPRTSPQSA